MQLRPPYRKDKDRKEGCMVAARSKTQETAHNINEYKNNAQFFALRLCLY